MAVVSATICFVARRQVIETVYKGNIRLWGKTKKSLSVIHIPETLAADLGSWRFECPDSSSPEAFIFTNQAGNFMDTDNYRKRVLHRLARDLKLPKLTFQVIRRRLRRWPRRRAQLRTFKGYETLSYGNYPQRLYAGYPGERAVGDELHSPGVAQIIGERTQQTGESSSGGYLRRTCDQA